MVLRRFLFFTILVIYLEYFVVNADITEEEMTSIMVAINPQIIECAKDYDNISVEELIADMQKSEPDLFPCFVGCVLKKLKIFDDQMKLDAELLLAMLTTHIKDKEELADIEKVVKQCSEVIENETSKDDDVCKKTKMLFDCAEEQDQEAEQAQ